MGTSLGRPGDQYLLAGLVWCVVGPIKAQCHNIVSCNLIVVIKADSGKMAEHHFEIDKGCEGIDPPGIKTSWRRRSGVSLYVKVTSQIRLK